MGGIASVGGIPLKPLGRHPDPLLQGKAPLVTWCCHSCDTCLLSTYYASDSALAPDETETGEVWFPSALNLQMYRQCFAHVYMYLPKKVVFGCAFK